MNNNGKVLYIKPSRSALFRVKKRRWNYYKTALLASVTFNIIALFALMMR